MLSVCRRLVVALLAIVLMSQLVQGQLLLCAQTDMSGPSMTEESMADASHMQHEAMPAHAVASDHGTQSDEPISPDCVLAASCVNATAVPALSQPALMATAHTNTIVWGTTSAPTLTVLPELPPPRV